MTVKDLKPFLMVVHRLEETVEVFNTVESAKTAGYQLPADYVGHEPVIIIVD